MSRPKRRRGVPLYVWVNDEEYAAIKERMEQAGTENLSGYIRKMALNGYVLNVDLAPVRELVSLQRRCANNLNQVAILVNTYGALYQSDITALQKDYVKLWGRVSDILQQLTAVVEH
ncbi:plasmid mobilization relaxosome protein MobC [Paenibacillus sp. RS8]|uniref:plasmid mobilization protein n=1 Tax=Paenibacillus sp. RS8 TaxID=3242681 RepID=UPI0035BF1E19